MRTASHPYNNRHRQAPSTHTDKQAVRTMKLRTMFDYPRVHFECHAPEQNWRFCCLRTFQFFYAMRSTKGTHLKIKHFFANYQSFGLLFTIFNFSLAKLHPQNAKSRQGKFLSQKNRSRLLNSSM